MSISYESYRIFYHVASCKSFTMAARILHNSQPNITRIMANLERDLGQQLFLRTNRGITLTQEGELLYTYVSRAVQSISYAEGELIRMSRLTGGQITIAVGETALRSVLLPALHDFRQDFPGVQIHLRSMTSEDAVQELQQRLSDMAVMTRPIHESDALQVTDLVTFPDVLVISREDAGKRDLTHPLALKDITAWPFVSMPRASASFERLHSYFALQGLLFQPTTFVSSLTQMVPMVLSGLGAAFLPAFMAEEEIARGELVPVALELPPPAHTVSVMTRAGENQSPVCREMMARLQKAAQKPE
ncbi:MAG: LysR family transcriptional regulator [Clostridia bacterium]|nr:LysR family transcriptional regulator [Clostridia bacterium]